MNKLKITIFHSKNNSYYSILADFGYVYLCNLSKCWCLSWWQTFFFMLGLFFNYFYPFTSLAHALHPLHLPPPTPRRHLRRLRTQLQDEQMSLTCYMFPRVFCKCRLCINILLLNMYNCVT